MVSLSTKKSKNSTRLADAACVFSGVRPSSGAAARVAIGRTKQLDYRLLFPIAAPEDGRTPLNRYDAAASEFLCEHFCWSVRGGWSTVPRWPDYNCPFFR